MHGEHPLPGPREKEIFFSALEISTANERAVFLDRACGDDQMLRASVEALLKNHKGDDYFEQLSAEIRPAMVSGEAVGDRIGRYKLLEEIGEGGCGVVYLAEQEGPLRLKVALKVIKLGMDTKQVISRFQAERQVLAKLEHSNIARVYDAGATTMGRPYFVMELVRGQRITDYADSNRLTLRQRLGLFIKVCHAVQHAHEKGIIHRDIKPSNILVAVESGEPLPKVIDFGIAKITDGDQSTNRTLVTLAGQFVGTPDYMSPEQAESSVRPIDKRTDIYSLGVLLYELLIGCLPLNLAGLGLQEQLRTILEIGPQKPSKRYGKLAEQERLRIAQSRNINPADLLHSLQGDLDRVVMKCLEKNRERRYETIEGLLRHIQLYLEDEKKHFWKEPIEAPKGINQPQEPVEAPPVGHGSEILVYQKGNLFLTPLVGSVETSVFITLILCCLVGFVHPPGAVIFFPLLAVAFTLYQTGYIRGYNKKVKTWTTNTFPFLAANNTTPIYLITDGEIHQKQNPENSARLYTRQIICGFLTGVIIVVEITFCIFLFVSVIDSTAYFWVTFSIALCLLFRFFVASEFFAKKIPKGKQLSFGDLLLIFVLAGIIGILLLLFGAAVFSK